MTKRQVAIEALKAAGFAQTGNGNYRKTNLSLGFRVILWENDELLVQATNGQPEKLAAVLEGSGFQLIELNAASLIVK